MTITDENYAALAVEQWRLIRVLEKLIDRLPPEARARVHAQTRFAASNLSSLVGAHQIQLESFVGRAFEPSLPIVAVNGDDFEGMTDLYVSEMLEPAVIKSGRVVQLGRALIHTRVEDAPRD